MKIQLLLLGGASALVFLILVGASWLEKPALGLAMATVVSCLALVLLYIGEKTVGEKVEQKAKSRGRTR